MKTPTCIATLLTTILGVASFIPNLPGDEPRPATPTPAADQAKPRVNLINIDFPGGSISEFLATMAKSNAGPFNVIGEKEEMAARLPAFSLRDVEPQSLGAVLTNLMRLRGLNFTSASGDFRTYVLTKNEIYRVVTPESIRSMFQCFQLAPYLADCSVDDVVAAIRAGWELDPAHDPNVLRIKFHPATSVLLVSGPIEAMIVAQNVLAQIKHKNPTGSKPTPAPEPEKK